MLTRVTIPQSKEAALEVLKILQSMASIMEDPKAAKASIREIIALSASEQQKVEEAIEYLSKSNDLKDEMSKRESEAKNILSQARKHEDEARNITSVNNEVLENIKRTRKQQEEKDVAHKIKDREHAEKDALHQRERQDLDRLHITLSSKETEQRKLDEDLKRQSRELKEKVERVAKIAGI